MALLRSPAARTVAAKAVSVAKLLLLLLLVWVGVGLITVAVIATACGGRPEDRKAASVAVPQRTQVTAGLAEYARPEADSYFSYPEWYIVWSYQEKAAFQATRLPSGFPYGGAIGQYWRAYCTVNRLAQGKYGFNAPAHVMLIVIGTSFTVEYALKGVYEKTIGRLSEWLSGHQMVEEDAFAAQVARQYADFVLVRPFYEFSFLERFVGLWKETPLLGRHMLRKLERRVFLSFDYAVEAFYCELIELATRLAYGVAGTDTYAWLENARDTVWVENPHVRRVRQAGPGSYLVIIPRYQEFTPTAIRLAERGVRFAEIAGNHEIVLSVLAPDPFSSDLAPGQVLFSSRVLSQPGRERLVVLSPVAGLHTVLAALRARGLEVEHIYDY